jgi:hypothetical protein
VRSDSDLAIVRRSSGVSVGLAVETEAGREWHALAAAVGRIRVVDRRGVAGGTSSLVDEGPVVEGHKERIGIPIELLVKSMTEAKIKVRTA